MYCDFSRLIQLLVGITQTPLRQSNRLFSLLLACLIAPVLFVTQSYAQNIPIQPGPDFDIGSVIANYKSTRSPSLYLSPLDNSLMGESHDIDTGALTFRQVDVSIPGNNSLPVEFARRADGQTLLPDNVQQLSEIGKVWEVDLPYIVTRKPQGSSGNCDVPYNGEPSWANVDPNYDNFFFNESLFVGTKIYTPGSAERDLGTQMTQTPSGFYGTRKLATRDLWIATCLPTANSSGVVGYKVKSPNGDTYTFEHRKVVSTTFNFLRVGNNQSSFPTDIIYLMPTEIVDVHGNWVKYEYNAHGVTRIHSSDNREITMGYTGNLITSVSANNRQWAYSYGGTNNEFLGRIDLPDNRYWSFGENEDGFFNNGMQDYDCLLKRIGSDYRKIVMRHPSGTVAEFETEVVVNYIKNIPNQPYRRPVGAGGGYGTHKTSCSYGSLSPEIFFSRAMTSKTLELSSGEQHQWTFDYHEPVGTWGQACVQYNTSGQYPTGACMMYSKQFFGSDTWIANQPDTKKRTIINPLGHKTVHHLNVDWYKDIGEEIKVGAVIKTETFETAISSSPLETINFLEFENHDAFSGDITYKSTFGNATDFFLPKKKTIQRDGDTFTYEHSYNMNPSATDFGYTKPVQTKVYSNVSTAPRVTDTLYYNDRSIWKLGLTKRVTQNDRVLATNNYTSLGQFESQIRYGRTIAELRYNSDGTIDEIEDAIGRITKLSDWVRGRPETIKPAFGTTDEITLGQTIDPNGWITAHTDAMNRTTNFDYDPMGRITLIDLYGDWDDTSITYDYSGGGAVQTITKGQSEETVTYDSMYRKILEKTQDLSTNWVSYVNTAYDGLGRITFKSQPSASPTELNGVDTTYDALGRVLTVAENVSPFATTTHSYHSGHRYRVTQPNGAWTDYISRGYDGPGSKDYTQINEYNNRTTTLNKNIYGQVLSVSQSGSQGGVLVSALQEFFYNSDQRLCGYRGPEGGSTRYQYDNAGQMIAYAKGTTVDSSCPVPLGASRVTLSYDKLGHLKHTDFVDTSTPDIFHDYDDNGNITSTRRGSGYNTITWDYGYNDLDLLTSETLTIYGRTYAIGYLYNSAGHLLRRDNPNGFHTDYLPDGLGRATGAKYNTTNYASNASYHTSGTLTDFAYGNGFNYTKTLNARLLPSRIHALGGGETALDLNYSYNAIGKITTIIDGAVTGNNRYYGYDALGQMISATGPWGGMSASYDSLGNMLSRNLGSRTITLNYDGAKNRVNQSLDSLGSASGGTGTRTVDYDSRGNVTTLGTLGMVYDYSDQPIAVSGTANGVGSANGNYMYDGNLKRVKSTVNGRTIYNIYSQSGQLVHIDERPYTNDLGQQVAEKRTDYVSLGGMTVARVENKTTATYIFSDHLGSPVATKRGTDAIKRERYTPFGIAMDDNPDLTNQAGFTGHIKDAATGLNYMQARYYDPVMGRFLSIDPVTFLQTGDPSMFNRYSYVANDPINDIDPDGRCRTVTCFVLNGQKGFEPGRYNTGTSAIGAANVVAKSLDVGTEFAPVVGDAKDIMKAGANPTAGTILAAGVGLAPVVGDVAKQPIKHGDEAKSALSSLNLQKQLASESQVADLASGGGTVISQPAKQAQRIAAETGANPADIQKVSSGSFVAKDGQTVQTHSFRDASSNTLIEPKTIINENP